MSYQYGIRNRYRPSSLAPNAFGWSSQPQYNRADVPTGLLGNVSNVPDETTVLQQFAYEWFQSSALGGDFNLSNPPFVSGAAGRLLPSLRDVNGSPARILRGYIRRAQTDVGDDLSKARLYFMYNPESITRDYVSYLNQSALDPFNTVYQSENLVAPPSILDFSFSLFFDRQEEAGQPDHPGVFVDYQFFDLVVRNVVPTDPNQSSNTLPDNGVMMVNPRNITVVFSPQLTVEGRPLNATVNFEKFTHRMTPTRMTIQLQMRAVYLGPIRDQVEHKPEQLQAEAAISIEDKITLQNATQSWVDNNEDTVDFFKKALALTDPFGTGGPAALASLLGIDISTTNSTPGLVDTASGGSRQARLAALTWAQNNVNSHTRYDATAGLPRHNLPISADCSGLVCEAYNKTGTGRDMHWEYWPGTDLMMQGAIDHPEKQVYKPFSSFNWRADLEPGDLLIRGKTYNKAHGHVKFFVRYQGSAGSSPDAIEGRKLVCFGANGSASNPQVGETTWSGPTGGEQYYLLRPMPFGDLSSLARSPVYASYNKGLYGTFGKS
jgi:hypothetical protein